MTANTSRRFRTAFMIMMVCIPVAFAYEFISDGRITVVGLVIGIALAMPLALLEESTFDERMRRLPFSVAILAKMTAEVGDLKKGLIFNGDVLNTGCRLQGECARLGRRLVSSADLFERLDLPDEWTTEAMGPVTLRGKAEPTELVAFA